MIYENDDNNIKYQDIINTLIDRKLTRTDFNQQFQELANVDVDIISRPGSVMTLEYNPSLYRFHPNYDGNGIVVGGSFY